MEKDRRMENSEECIRRVVALGLNRGIAMQVVEAVFDALNEAAAVHDPVIRYGRHGAPLVVMDTALRTLTVNGDEIHLQRKQFQLLEFMLRSAGLGVICFRDILMNVWGPAHGQDVHYLRVGVSAVNKACGVPLIRNRTGEGYYVE